MGLVDVSWWANGWNSVGVKFGSTVRIGSEVSQFGDLSGVGRYVVLEEAFDVLQQSKISRQRFACFSSHGFWLSVKLTVFVRFWW